MVLVNLNHNQFHRPPTKVGLHSDEWPTTSNFRVPGPRWEGNDFAALGASQDSTRVVHNPDLIQPQNLTGPLQKDSLDSFRAPGLGFKDSKVDMKTAHMLSQRVNKSWDNRIPLSCAGDRLHPPRFRKIGALEKTACDPIRINSGDDSFPSDDSGSNIERETSSATTPMCAVSPGASSSNEGKVDNTVIGSEDAGGFVTAAQNSPKCQGSWLDIDSFPDSGLGFDNSAAEDERQKMGDIEDESVSDGTGAGQAEDVFQEMDHNINIAENGPGGEDEVKRGVENFTADPEMDGIEVESEGSHGKDGYRARADSDTEGARNSSDSEVPPAPGHSSTSPVRPGNPIKQPSYFRNPYEACLKARERLIARASIAQLASGNDEFASCAAATYRDLVKLYRCYDAYNTIVSILLATDQPVYSPGWSCTVGFFQYPTDDAAQESVASKPVCLESNSG